MKKIAFQTLGCKLNFSETSAILRQFKAAGFEQVDFDKPSDVYVINTCSVTENADKECKRIVRKALSLSPNAKIAVIGCYAQLKPKEIAAIPGVSVVLGANEKFNLLSYIDEDKTEVVSCEIATVESFINAYSIGDRTRSFLKVQDGCDYSCSFCTIPLARGKSRSNSIDSVLQSAKEIVKDGVKEIVLTGINIGDFGKQYSDGVLKAKDENFFQLIQALDDIQEIERIRISSIEPNLLTNDIIDFVASSNTFMPHFHIPLQSGSDEILALMKRRYQSALYKDRVAYIKQLMPHCCIGVDVIVGFPGETDTHFMETYNFLKNLDVCYFHVFTYSERDNTEALDIKPVVPMHIRKERSKMLRILSEKKRRLFYENNMNEKRAVLFEAANRDGFMYGFTDNYIKVETAFDANMTNKVIPLKLSKINHTGNMQVAFNSELKKQLA